MQTTIAIFRLRATTDIGGQTLCLLLTLLVVPVAYSYLADWEAVPWAEWATRLSARARNLVRPSGND